MYTSPAKVIDPTLELPIAILPLPPVPAPISPERVIAPVFPETLLISKVWKRALAPTFPDIVTVPVPDNISRFFVLISDASIVLENSIFPVPVPELIATVVPLIVTGALMSIRPLSVSYTHLTLPTKQAV